MTASQTETPSPGATDQPERRGVRLLRLHCSTWVALLLSAFLLVVLNVPGDATGDWYFDSSVTVRWQHGWPWVYLDRESTSWPQANPNWLDAGSWTFEGTHGPPRYLLAKRLGWRPLALLGDALVAAAIMTAVVLLMERRHRRRRLWQVSLGEFVFLSVLVCFCAGWWVIATRDAGVKKETALRDFGLQNCRFEYTGPRWLRLLVGAEQLRGLERLKEVYSLDVEDSALLRDFPTIERIRLADSPSAEQVDLERCLENLTACRRLSHLAADLFQLDEPDFRRISQLKSLRHLEIRMIIEPKRATGFLAAERLESLVLTRVLLKPGQLNEIAKLKNLKSLYISAPIDRREFANVCRLARLDELGVTVTGLRRADVVRLLDLERLTFLELSGAVGDAVLEPLGELKSLVVLDVRSTDASSALISRLEKQLPDCVVINRANASSPESPR